MPFTIPIFPKGISRLTVPMCIAKRASTLGFSKAPSATIISAPRLISSAVWNMSLTEPLRLSFSSLNIFAAPKSIAACASCPHPCIQPFVLLNGRSVSSVCSSASMSALRATHLSVFFPSITATMPVSRVFTLYLIPILSSSFVMYSVV